MLQVGFGKKDISPAPNAEMPGGFFPRKAKGIREPLWAVATVVYDGTTPVALVGIDSLFITRPTVDIARRVIQKQTAIPGENILIGANHTHTGGPIASCLGCEGDPAYMDKVGQQIAEAVGEAWRSLHPAELGIGVGIETTIAYNRRFLMRDGREITHPGKPGTPHHKDIVAPAGPIDPDVGVLAIRAPRGKVIGLVVNFACHSTVVGGDQFHPDYVFYLRKHLEAHYGDGMHVCFLLGACGDITQVDNMSPARQFGHEYANMMGLKLAAEVIRVTERSSWLAEAPVRVATEIVHLSLRPDPDPDKERPPYGLGSGATVEPVYEQERKKVAEERRRSPRLPSEVQAIKIGPLGIATTGAEYFCEYALQIKKASLLQPAWVVSLANDYIGYVPTPQAHVAGGYEPRTARSSKLAIESGHQLALAAIKGLNRVSSG